MATKQAVRKRVKPKPKRNNDKAAFKSSPYNKYREKRAIEIRPKIYVNGFPKSGLHLAVTMAMVMVKEPAHEHSWAGTFGKNSFSTQWVPYNEIFSNLSRLREDSWLKGHCGYRPEVEQFLYHLGASKIFIYRDLRDVLVSQAHHVTSDDDDRFYHPDKKMFQSMDSFEDVLAACLCGVGPYAGLFERWFHYAPWLHIPWVHKVRFEDALLKPEAAARDAVIYTYSRMSAAFGARVELPERMVADLTKPAVDLMGQTDKSPTFRQGKTGKWREHFTPKITELFKQRGGDVLIRLGYEKDNNWQED